MLRTITVTLALVTIAPRVFAQSSTGPFGPASPSSAAPTSTSSSGPPSTPAAPPADHELQHPRILHTPPGHIDVGNAIEIRMDVLRPDLVNRIEVHYRPEHGAWAVERVTRIGEHYLAVLPAQPVSVHYVEYFVRTYERDGTVTDSFANEGAPFPILVQPSGDTSAEERELAYHDGQRLEIEAGGEYTNFGDTDGSRCGITNGRCPDQYYSMFGDVRYHFYRAVRSVSVRTERLIGVTTREVQGVRSSANVGLFAATVGIEFRLAPGVSWWFGGILGANETSVTGGGASTLTFGVDTPTRIELSFNGIVDYGISASAWMRWTTLTALPLGAGLEVTNQPGASSDFGVRMLVEAGHTFGRYFTLTLRGGYGSRTILAGGFSGAAMASVHF